MLDAGIIRPSRSSWASPIVMVKKKNGDYRFCVDYRKLNNITQRDVFPLPRIEDILERLKGNKMFSSVDCKSGFWNLRMAESSIHKTAFSCHRGLFEFLFMPFGLTNSPAEFQRAINRCCAGLPVVPYLDDILIADSEFEHHISTIRSLFERLKEWQFRLSIDKCEFVQDSIVYLGHVITCNGIKTNPRLIQKLQDIPEPTCVSDIRTFLGIVGYYRRFIENFSTKASPLTQLLKKDVKFVWTDECQNAFETLKNLLIADPVLQFPDITKPFKLQTDASGVGVGAVLTQMFDGAEKPVAYYSATLNAHEQRYSIFEKELLAIIKGIAHFKHYLTGTHFVIETDHSALVFLKTCFRDSHRLARWWLYLSEFDWEVHYRKGKANGNADALSRLFPPKFNDKMKEVFPALGDPRSQDLVQSSPVSAEDDNSESAPADNVSQNIDAAQINAIDQVLQNFDFSADLLKDLKVLQERNQFLFALKQFLLNESIPEDQEIKRFVLTYAKHCKLDSQGIILHFVASPSTTKTNNSWKPFLPHSLIDRVISFFHSSPIGGHFDVEHTLRRVQDIVYFTKMRVRISEFVSSCTQCQQSKDPTHPKRPDLNPIKCNKPFEHVIVDCFGPLKTSSSGNQYIVIFQDHFSKLVILQPCADITAETLSEILVTRVISVYGCPVILHSDRGSNFLSQHFTHTCKRFGITQNFSTAYRPQSQGLVERFNRTMGSYIRSFVDKRQEGWDQLIPFLSISYNSVPHSVTGSSPFSVLFGREMFLPVHFGYVADLVDEPSSLLDYKEFLSQNLDFLHSDIRKRTRVFQEKAKASFDSKKSSYSFQVGQQVLLVNHKRSNGFSKKLQPRFVGPYSIIDLDGVNATITLSEKSTPFVVHQNDLKPFISAPISAGDSSNVPSINPKPLVSCAGSPEVSIAPGRGVDEEISDSDLPPSPPARKRNLRARPKPVVRLDL